MKGATDSDAHINESLPLFRYKKHKSMRNSLTPIVSQILTVSTLGHVQKSHFFVKLLLCSFYIFIV